MVFDPNLYHTAAAHCSNGRFEDALHILQPMLDDPAADPEARNLAAVCCYRLNRPDEAETHWRRIIETHPDHAGSYGNLANLLMAQGRMADAEAVYRRTIALRPDFAEAHYNLGNLMRKVERAAEAEACFRAALRLRSDLAEAHYNLASLLNDTGRVAEAETAYLNAISVRPDYAEAFNNFGNLLREQGRLKEARTALRRAIALRPDFDIAHQNLGLLLQQMGQCARAQLFHRRATQLKPDYLEAHCSLGEALLAIKRSAQAAAAFEAALAIRADCTQALVGLARARRDTGRIEDAERIYREVLALQPDQPEALAGLAPILHDSDRLEEAEAIYRALIARHTDSASAHYNLGVLLGSQNRLHEAEAAYRRAIALRPDFAHAYTNLGRILTDMKRLPAAEAILRRSIAIEPESAEAHNNLATVLKDMSRMEEAIESFRRAVACGPDNECVHRNLNYALTYHAEEPQTILDECLRFAARHEAPLLADAVGHTNDRSASRRLKIGYVAPDFRTHCQSMFTLPVFAQHDHASFEIVCYASVKHPDALTDQFRGMADVWHDVHALDDAALAERIRDDRIDVLVDLTMHMAGGRPLLFARRPAPVQVQWLAYPGTTGSRAIRYRLTDPWIDPPEQPGVGERYSERSVWLPETFWCFDPRVATRGAPDVGPLPAERNQYITFGCLNNPCKASDRTLRMWAAVLAATPEARFILLAEPGARERFSERLNALGVDMSRVAFIGYQEREVYLNTYNAIDIGLDTYPYNGHTTSLDALWMGVPVPSRAGETACSRAGLSLLTNLGLPELVAHDDAAYVDIVMRLASDIPRLAALRASLRSRLESSPMMNAPRFTRNLENAYRAMWREWCATASD
ncbi:tetratricopeptide repeat protein [Caballeronia sp. LZ062]|uniref:tetratricopeptide repeat protein n=1 Tax=unclassified Caballeronia TaxID=2646786 RepID=UPI00285F0DF1|nr:MULTISPECIES: tetratricopeptide repeat protein [unclassified Caballeronia]MDR5854559.1 tetratricopeptide repeat protein [Caballeronia sp. LZ050]MDR5870912.1 tetratricopeptide repeat protein [Caballeronia sp. LZ062]